ncbi:Uncharacterized protein TCM_014528 [Theobroma cacao]|uniref:Uncharacterized protein n=1 Tax=Theobroma cacao TaxID=3641 RepID=A0A061FXR1_THECC|nr:Uncharacterized protein TCM_014528 [Theobroma cacao]
MLISPLMRESKSGDWISQLPNDIFIFILSSVTVKEAVATSLPSKRWRYLWAYISRLDFVLLIVCETYCISHLRFCDVAEEKFIHWVNSVVKMHQGLTLDEFRIDFPYLHGSPHLVNLKYSGPSLKLKYLSSPAIDAGLKCIEICNINIVSFKYFGRKLILQLKNLPRLVELYVSPGYRRRLSYAFAQVSCIFSQLLSWVKPKMRRQVVETVERPHQHPKVVELAGCYGRTTDVELAIYFIQNAVALKKMIINPRNQEMDSEKEIS